MLVEAAASSLPSMLVPVVDDFELPSLRVFRVARVVLFAMLVRLCRVMVSHWPTILFFLHFSLAEKKRLHKNFSASWTTAVLVAFELGQLCGSSPAYMELRNVEDRLS